MKKTKIVTTAVASLALVLLSSQAILAKDGIDDDSNSNSGSSVSTPKPAEHENEPAETPETEHKSTSTSGSSGTSGKISTDKVKHVEIENEDIQEVDLENDDDDTESNLGDDDDKNEVTVVRRNGRILAVTKSSNGKVESEKELKGADSVSISSVDSSGKKHVVKIKTVGDHFKVVDAAAEATTNFPLMLDPKSNTLSLVTPAGTVAVKVLPAKAIEALEEDDLLDEVHSAELEMENGDDKAPATVPEAPKAAPAGTNVVLRVKGVKHVNFLNFFPVDAVETASVNVVTGAEKVESRPWYLNIFGFLFSGK